MVAWQREQHGALAVLTFTRPPKSWVNLASMTELADLLGGIAGDEATSVVMLTGGTQRLPRLAGAAKEAVVGGLSLPLDEGLRHEFGLFRQLNSSDEAKQRNAEIVQPG